MRIVLICSLLFVILGCKKDKIRFVQKTYPEDSLISEGYMIDTLPIKYWKSFDLQKRLVAISEFKIINNEAYLNQEVVFDKRGDTLFDNSNFFTCKTEIINKDSLLLKIEYYGIYNESYGLFLYNYNINDDFSNIDKLKLDTIFFDTNKFEIRLPKNKEIKGIIKEIKFLSNTYKTRNVYFDYGRDYQDISEIR